MSGKNIENAARAAVANSEEVYCYVGGAGTGKTAGINDVNKGKMFQIRLEPDPNGRVYAYNATSNAKLGWVLGESNSSFSVVKAKEPATNIILNDAQVVELLEGNSIVGYTVSMATFNIIKVKIKGEDIANLAEGKTITTNSAEDNSIQLDFTGITPENEQKIRDRLSHISNLGYSSKVMEKIQQSFVKFMSTRESIPDFEPCFINYDFIEENAIMSILAGANLCLSGSKGTGKNKLVDHLASLFAMELCSPQMSSDTAKEEIMGAQTIVDDGKVAFRISNILEAATKPSIICLDEVNMVRGSITSLLHSVTDQRRCVDISGHETVRVHPQARFIITMNEGEEYEGIRNVNGAFRDRFHEIVFEPRCDHMALVFKTACKTLTDEQVAELTGFYTILFNAVNSADGEGEIPVECLSQRSFIRAANLIAMGFEESVESAVKRCVVDSISDKDVRACLEMLYSWHN